MTVRTGFESVEETVARALAEDAADADRTSLAVVPALARARGRLLARAAGVLAGREYAEAAFRACDPGVRLEWLAADGDSLAPEQLVLSCWGSARGLLAAERTALNFLQQLSGVATLTRACVLEAAPVRVFDTRKTAPGLRTAQKLAVFSGGGHAHRRDLEDLILLKENHFALAEQDYGRTVACAVAAAGGRVVGAEARSVPEALAALAGGADYVLLDNFTAGTLPEAVAAIRAIHPGAELEASGGYGPGRLRALAASGVDRVSLGALTHSAPALDLSFYVEADPAGQGDGE
ncbi:MAG TPA: carboxylating nicotinate-nucleotide diphosphorylase [Planctomycetota bacterium]